MMWQKKEDNGGDADDGHDDADGDGSVGFEASCEHICNEDEQCAHDGAKREKVSEVCAKTASQGEGDEQADEADGAAYRDDERGGDARKNERHAPHVLDVDTACLGERRVDGDEIERPGIMVEPGDAKADDRQEGEGGIADDVETAHLPAHHLLGREGSREGLKDHGDGAA